MTIVYTAPPHGDSGFSDRCLRHGVEAILVKHSLEFARYPGANLFIDGSFDGSFPKSGPPLMFHAPDRVFSELPVDLPVNCARFCAWPGFWERGLWEMATRTGGPFGGERALGKIGISTKQVGDSRGLIAPRILCTIISEAAYTIGEGVSGAEEVDIAMKLGTNYPHGPIEWAKKIGFSEVWGLLEAMGRDEKKYCPHPGLKRLIEL